jgi:hypothetical protein
MASKRRSLEETKGLLIEAGLQLLLRRGLRSGVTHVTLVDVIEELSKQDIPIAMGSVYRIWSAGQEGFQRDVQIQAAKFYDTDADLQIAATVETAMPFVEKAARARTPSAKRELLSEAVRLAGAKNLEITVADPAFAMYVGMWALATTGESTDVELVEVLKSSADVQEVGLVEMYVGLAEAFGRKEKYPGAIRDFAIAAQAMNQGMAIHASSHPEETFTQRPMRVGDTVKDWTIFGAVLNAMIDVFTIPA